MTEDPSEPDWKLKLRYGRLTTPYSHYTVLGDGVMTIRDNDFGCPLGTASMAIKVWASSTGWLVPRGRQNREGLRS